MAQIWEYKFIQSAKKPKLKDAKDGGVLVVGFEDESTWTEDNQPVDGHMDIFKRAGELGREAWELVTVVPISSFHSMSTAGITTDYLWIFKRPKS